MHLVLSHDGPFLCGDKKDSPWTYDLEKTECVKCLRVAVKRWRVEWKIDRDTADDLRRELEKLQYAIKALKLIDKHVDSIGDGAMRSRAEQIAITQVHRAVGQLKRKANGRQSKKV